MAQKTPIKLPRGTQVPDHIAVILDGNGRWARSRNLRVTKGHEHGAEALSKVMRAAREMGVHTVTVWGFSTENWKRPPREVAKIMGLIKSVLNKEIKNAHKDKIRLIHLGRKDRIPGDVMKIIDKAERETAHYTDHVVNIAIDYGGRDEILRATKKMLKDNVNPSELDEELYSSYLDTADQPYPYPDLFIRTSGEQRTSGYLPWQMVYTEFYFEQEHLPDMTPENLKVAVLDYSRRRRRYGAKDKVKHLTFKPEVVANLEMNWWRLQKVPEGTKFTEFAIDYLKEQYGLSKNMAKKAAKYMVAAMLSGRQSNWEKAREEFKQFYILIKDHLKLAFEPEIVASLRIKLLQNAEDIRDSAEATSLTDIARDLFAEEYRISNFQAAKAAHLRVLAQIERNKAENGMGDIHWKRAEDYLQLHYRALKDRVA